VLRSGSPKNTAARAAFDVALARIVERELAHGVDEQPRRAGAAEHREAERVLAAEQPFARERRRRERQQPQARRRARQRRRFLARPLLQARVQLRQVVADGQRIDDRGATTGVVHVDRRPADLQLLLRTVLAGGRALQCRRAAPGR
jgi:hypothetical protein